MIELIFWGFNDERAAIVLFSNVDQNMHMKCALFVLLKHAHVFKPFAEPAKHPVIELLPYLLQVAYGHFGGVFMRPFVGRDGEKAPFFVPKTLVKRVEQVGSPITRVLVGTAWAAPLFAADTNEGDIPLSVIVR